MRYFLNLVDPERWSDFLHGGGDTWGFSEHRRAQAAAHVKPGSRLICLLTKRQVWCGVLEVTGEMLPLHDLRVARDKNLPVRFPVKALVALPVEQAISVIDPNVWHYLSRTRGVEPHAPGWNARAGLRGDLTDLKADGELLASRLLDRGRQMPLPYDADTEAFDPADIADARARVMRQIAVRRGQQAFRNELLRAYAGRCAITGCEIVDVLEAAHITPYLGPEMNRVNNGLLLRADLHTLFDCGLIGVNPDNHSVIVHYRLHASEYEELHGRPLRLPEADDDAPSRKALQKHATDFGLIAGRQGTV